MNSSAFRVLQWFFQSEAGPTSRAGEARQHAWRHPLPGMEWIRKVGRRGKDAARRASATLQDQLALPKDLDDIDF